MDWVTENRRDAKLLNKIDLSPLDAADAEGNEQLAELVDRHNTVLTEPAGRFRQLADDRTAMANPDNWLDCDSTTVGGGRRRVIAESWDVLVSLRKALGDRQAICRQLEAHVAGQSSELADQREKAFAKAQQALAREHGDYLKAEPARGQAYIEDLANEDEAVVELRRQSAALDAVFDRFQSIRHKAQTDVSAVMFRQREVIEHLTC